MDQNKASFFWVFKKKTTQGTHIFYIGSSGYNIWELVFLDKQHEQRK